MKRKQTPATRRKQKKWIVLGRPYMAMTKSEARARAKEAIGGRLPVGTIITAA